MHHGRHPRPVPMETRGDVTRQPYRTPINHSWHWGPSKTRIFIVSPFGRLSNDLLEKGNVSFLPNDTKTTDLLTRMPLFLLLIPLPEDLLLSYWKTGQDGFLFWMTHHLNSSSVSKLVAALSPVNHKGLYIRVENKLQSISQPFNLHVIKPQLSVKYFAKKPTQHTSYFIEHTNLSGKVKLIISKCQPRKKITHVLKPIYIPRAINTGTFISSAGWPVVFYLPTQEPVLATVNTEKISGEVWKKCWWMDRAGWY